MESSASAFLIMLHNLILLWWDSDDILSRCSPSDRKKLVDVKQTARETTLCLAAAHALVRLDDDTIVGDPMEKTTLEALDWKLSKGASSFLFFHCRKRR